MFIYFYKDLNIGEIYEFVQYMCDDFYIEYFEIGVLVKWVLLCLVIVFKGSGFYVNDLCKLGGEGGGGE